eukprot:COSAG02_NODE_32867_length_509_cov_0.878049_1_plen_59_part_00
MLRNGSVDIDEFPILMGVIKELEHGLTMGHALRVLSKFREHRNERRDDVRSAEPPLPA